MQATSMPLQDIIKGVETKKTSWANTQTSTRNTTDTLGDKVCIHGGRELT